MIWPQQTSPQPLLAIPGIHFFDAHRLQPQLLQAPALQLHSARVMWQDPKGWWDASSDEERATTDVRLMWRRCLKMQIFLLRSRVSTDPGRTWWSHGNGNRRCCWQAGNHDEELSTSGQCFLPAEQPRCSAFIMAPSQAHHLANFYTR